MLTEERGEKKNRRGHSEAVSAIRTTTALCSSVLVTKKVYVCVCGGGPCNFWPSVYLWGYYLDAALVFL